MATTRRKKTAGRKKSAKKSAKRPAARKKTAKRATKKSGKKRAPNPAFMNGVYFSGGGGLVSTAPDYAQFALMLAGGGELNGVRILSPRLVELMGSAEVACVAILRSCCFASSTARWIARPAE